MFAIAQKRIQQILYGFCDFAALGQHHAQALGRVLLSLPAQAERKA